MTLGLLDKLTNFFMPVEENIETDMPVSGPEHRAQLRVHSPSSLRIYVGSPQAFDDARIYADYLKNHVAVLVNFDGVDKLNQERIFDFLSGVLYVSGGAAQRISDGVHLFAPAHVDVNKELYAYSVPTYVRREQDR